MEFFDSHAHYNDEKFENDRVEILNKLYSSIDDPNLLQVDDSEFKEIKRKNPDITHLKILEQKKENEKTEFLVKSQGPLRRRFPKHDRGPLSLGHNTCEARNPVSRIQTIFLSRPAPA